MRTRLLLLLALAASLAVAASPRIASVTSVGGTGVAPFSNFAGVNISVASSIRVRVSAAAGNISGGKVCAFYLPPGGADGGWLRNGGLDLTIPATTELDAGTVRATVLPDLAVVGGYGRVSFAACGITGTADDAGVNSYTVSTEAWGSIYPP